MFPAGHLFSLINPGDSLTSGHVSALKLFFLSISIDPSRASTRPTFYAAALWMLFQPSQSDQLFPMAGSSQAFPGHCKGTLLQLLFKGAGVWLVVPNPRVTQMVGTIQDWKKRENSGIPIPLSTGGSSSITLAPPRARHRSDHTPVPRDRRHPGKASVMTPGRRCFPPQSLPIPIQEQSWNHLPCPNLGPQRIKDRA